VLAISGCDDETDGSPDGAARDGAGADQGPAGCGLGPTPTTSRTLRFRVRNRGWNAIYTRVAYSCSMAMEFSSCATGYQDQLVQEFNVGGCGATSCPAGGQGCQPDGRVLAMGANEDRDIDTLLPVLSTQNGQVCVASNRILPPGRYRWAATIYATQAEAAAGVGGKRYQQEFDLLPGLGPQLVEIHVSLDPPDGGADAGVDAGADVSADVGSDIGSDLDAQAGG
jgi:hypothetical protein